MRNCTVRLTLRYGQELLLQDGRRVEVRSERAGQGRVLVAEGPYHSVIHLDQIARVGRRRKGA